MRVNKPLVLALSAALLVSAPVSADVGTGMSDWFNSMGGFSNATPPSSYKTQTMNGYSGGGFYVRNPVKNYQLMSATAPSLNIGCGGIDLTAGSFSFINKSTITAMFQNIGTSLSYAFLLAIKSSMPEMGSLFEYLQDEASKINNANINSCEAAQGITFAMGADTSQRAKDAYSHVTGTLGNLAPDSYSSWNSARADAKAQRDAQAAAIAADPSKKNFYQPGNVVWQALKNTSGLDVQDKELIMSMTGTIIIADPTGDAATDPNGGKTGAWHYKEPTGIRVEDFIGYNDGATETFRIWTCDEPIDCLSPTASVISAQTFMTAVSAKIDNMVNAVNSRTSQNTNDFHVVDISSVPVWKMISLSATTQPDLVSKYKRFIAVDIAYSYVNNLLYTANQTISSGKIEPAAPDAQQALKELKDNLATLKAELYSQRIAENGKLQSAVELERQLQSLHQAMVAGIPAQAFTSMSVMN